VGIQLAAFLHLRRPLLGLRGSHAAIHDFRWTDAVFEPFQTLEGKGGRAFLFFEDESEAYLAFAKILGDTLVYRWNGTAFVEHQILSGPGGRSSLIWSTRVSDM
jgi:hypothetical protein